MKTRASLALIGVAVLVTVVIFSNSISAQSSVTQVIQPSVALLDLNLPNHCDVDTLASVKDAFSENGKELDSEVASFFQKSARVSQGEFEKNPDQYIDVKKDLKTFLGSNYFDNVLRVNKIGSYLGNVCGIDLDSVYALSPSSKIALEQFAGESYVMLRGAENRGGKCLIATAAFGSELSPQVQFLRGFRDNHILSTESGSSFMNVFNAWYYSFSPYVADYERQQPWLQQIVKTSIYPLLGILTLSEKGFSSIQGDYGALAAGTIASSMIGAVYFWPFALSVKQVRTSRFNYKIIASVIIVVTIAVIISIILGNKYALMATTSLFVLTFLSVSAILVAKLITSIKNRISKKSIRM